jgi:hypothetical protein
MNMKQARSMAAAFAVTWNILSTTSAQSDSDVNRLIRGSDGKMSSIDTFKESPLDDEHDSRRLQSSSCAGDDMMCGCSDVRQSDYRGHFSVTRSGFNCKEWSMADSFPNQGLEDGAFCRNPNGVGQKAWCFVEDGNGVMWDYCDVPNCESGSSGDITPGCFNTARYNDIYADIEEIKNSIDNDFDRSHFLGGIVRLVAHDFMVSS